jgi:hypothetical protein
MPNPPSKNDAENGERLIWLSPHDTTGPGKHPLLLTVWQLLYRQMT